MHDNHLRRDIENGGGGHSQNCAYFPRNGASRQAMAWRPRAKGLTDGDAKGGQGWQKCWACREAWQTSPSIGARLRHHFVV